MGAVASQITNLTSVYSSVYPDADQRKHQSSASLAYVRGIHRYFLNANIFIFIEISLRFVAKGSLTMTMSQHGFREWPDYKCLLLHNILPLICNSNVGVLCKRVFVNRWAYSFL